MVLACVAGLFELARVVLVLDFSNGGGGLLDTTRRGAHCHPSPISFPEPAILGKETKALG